MIETGAYLNAAKRFGVSEEEREQIVNLLAANPQAGDMMPGCGGARKFRFAREGGGKSGGYRIVTYFAGQDVPAFLLTVFDKTVKANLSKAEQNMFAEEVKRLRDSLIRD